MFFQCVFYIVLLAFLSGLPLHVGANERFVIGVEDINYEPYYNEDNGVYYGAARELLDLFAKQQGYTFQYKLLPIKRLFNDFIRVQDLDFKFPDNPKWQPELKESVSVIYSDIVFEDKTAIMVRPANRLMQLHELKKLGTILGFTPWPFMDRIKQKQIKLYQNRSFVGLLQQTIVGRVDGAYINSSVARYTMKHTLKKPGVLVAAENLPAPSGQFFLSTLKHTAVIEQFNQFLVEKVVEIKAIKDKFEIQP